MGVINVPYDCMLGITVSAPNGWGHQLSYPFRAYLGRTNGGGSQGPFAEGEEVRFESNGISSLSVTVNFAAPGTWTFVLGAASWTVVAYPSPLGLRNHILDDDPMLYWALQEQDYGHPDGDSVNARAEDQIAGNHGSFMGSIWANSNSGMGEGPEICRLGTTPQLMSSRAPFLNGTGIGSTAQYIYRTTSPFSGAGDFTYETWGWIPPDFMQQTALPYHNLMQQRLNPRADGGMIRVGVTVIDAFGTPASVFLRMESADIITGGLSVVSNQAGCWCHVAATRESGLCSLILNGTLVGQATSNVAITNQNLSIGGDQPDINPFLTEAEQELMYGRMAHFAIFDHAVSLERLVERFNLGCTQCGEEPPLRLRQRSDSAIGAIGVSPRLDRFQSTAQTSNRVYTYT